MMTLLRNCKGQSLIEILITVLIIAGSIIALIQFQAHLLYTNNLNQQQNTALTLAKKQIETLRDFTALTGSNSYQSIASGSSSTAVTSATYTTTWTVTTATNPDYKTLSVVVSWQDQRGVNQSVNLVSRVGRIDPAYSAAIMG